MADQRVDKIRLALDLGVLTSIVALAFYAGVLHQQIEDLREAVTTRGRVQISIEASNRLTALETNDRRQDMRLDRLESPRD